MKNKIYYMLLCLISSFAFMNNVFAEENLNFTVSAEVVGGETTVVKGSEVLINVKVSSDLYVSACTFEHTYDSGLTFSGASQANNYVVTDGGNGKILVDGPVDVTTPTNGTLVQLKYTVNNSGKVTIKTPDCTSPTDNKTGSYDDVIVEFNAIDAADDSSLSNITVTGGTLEGGFNSGTKSYIVHLNNANFSLGLTASNSAYQDKIVVTDSSGATLDPSNITYSDTTGNGAMQITITVNSDTQYLLLVRMQNDLDNSLSSLKVGGKTVNLETGKYSYTVSVGSDVNSVKIEAELKDSENFKFSENNGPKTLQLSNVSNEYSLIVVPKDSSSGGESVTYTLTVVKETGTSGNDNQNDSGGSGNDNNVTTNPSTGGISMFFMAFILLASLVGSVILYQKNLEGYNK